MICSEWMAEITESARRGGKPGQALDSHLAVCGECQERWKAECELTSHFRVLRIHALARRPDQAAHGSVPGFDHRREMLMREFARVHRRPAARFFASTHAPSWSWGLAAAAALLLAIGIGRELGLRTRHVQVRQPVPAHEAFMYEASADAGALSSEEFIAVPYAAPLATGEIVRVVRTDLYPDALASMGIDVNPAWSGEMAADVVVGEDGFPRAVRLAENTQF